MKSDGPARKDNLTAKTARGVGWLTFSTLVMAIARIGVIAIMARLLAPADFGAMGAAGIFIEFARLLSASGIIDPLVQRATLTDEEIETAFTANLISGTFSSILICIFAGSIARLFHMPALQHVLFACSLLFPIAAISAVSSKLLERSHNFSKIARSDMTSYFASSVAVGLPMAFMGFGVWALVVPMIVAAFVRSIVLFRAQPHRLRLRLHRDAYFSLMREGAGYSLQRLSNLISLKGDYFVVGSTLGPTLLGQYERAYVLMNLSNTLVSSTLSTVLFPAFSRVNHDPERMRGAFARCHAVMSLIFLPTSAISILLAPEIVRVLLGKQWSNAVLPFQILAAGMFFRTGYKVAGILLNSVGRVYRHTFAQTVYAVFVVGGALLLVRWGISGVALSTLIAIFVVYTQLVFLSTDAIDMSRLKLLAITAPGLMIAASAGALAYVVAVPLREHGVSAPLILLFAGGAAGAGIASLALLAPALLGRHALELLRPAARSLSNILARQRLPAFWLARLAR